MKIVLVGESWGVHEAKFRHALVGYSGRQLAQMMSEAELAPNITTSRGDIILYPSETDMIAHWRKLRNNHGIAVTNVFNEHPDGDNTELFFSALGDTDLPPIRIQSRVLRLLPTYRHHIDRLWAELEQLKPNLIIALGNYACWALLHQTKISEIRGTPKIAVKFGYKVLPTYHPAALRDITLRPDIISDLTKAAREAEYPEIRRIKRWITCEDPTTRERVTLDEIEAWLQKPADAYTCDIETGYALFDKDEIKNMTPQMRRILSELISMVSFARAIDDSVVIPFMTRDDSNLNYWKSPEDEAKAWKLLLFGLRSPVTKTFQNGIFDVSHFLRNGITVNNCEDDPMILQHAISPEERRGLGAMASRHSNEISWKQMRARGETLKRDE